MQPGELQADSEAPMLPSDATLLAAPRLDWAQVPQLALHLGRVPMAMLLQQAPAGTVVSAAAGIPDASQEGLATLCEALIDDVAARGCLLDAASSPAWAGFQAVASAPHVRFVFVLPLPTDGVQHPVWLALLDTAPRCSEDMADIVPGLKALAGHAGYLRELFHRQQLSVHLTQGREERLGRALHESESRLNLTEHTASVGSWSLDIHTGVVQHSEEFRSILGLNAGERVQDLDGMVQRFRPEWRLGLRKRLESCAQQGEAFDEEIQVQVPGMNPKWVRTVGNAVRDEGG
ncbi:MAG: hypothetical protein R3E94_20160, partial [Burkholderiaceae bacterium]